MRGVVLMGVQEGQIAWARLYMEFVERTVPGSARRCRSSGAASGLSGNFTPLFLLPPRPQANCAKTGTALNAHRRPHAPATENPSAPRAPTAICCGSCCTAIRHTRWAISQAAPPAANLCSATRPLGDAATPSHDRWHTCKQPRRATPLTVRQSVRRGRTTRAARQHCTAAQLPAVGIRSTSESSESFAGTSRPNSQSLRSSSVGENSSCRRSSADGRICRFRRGVQATPGARITECSGAYIEPYRYSDAFALKMVALARGLRRPSAQRARSTGVLRGELAGGALEEGGLPAPLSDGLASGRLGRPARRSVGRPGRLDRRRLARASLRRLARGRLGRFARRSVGRPGWLDRRRLARASLRRLARGRLGRFARRSVGRPGLLDRRRRARASLRRLARGRLGRLPVPRWPTWPARPPPTCQSQQPMACPRVSLLVCPARRWPTCPARLPPTCQSQPPTACPRAPRPVCSGQRWPTGPGSSPPPTCQSQHPRACQRAPPAVWPARRWPTWPARLPPNCQRQHPRASRVACRAPAPMAGRVLAFGTLLLSATGSAAAASGSGSSSGGGGGTTTTTTRAGPRRADETGAFAGAPLPGTRAGALATTSVCTVDGRLGALDGSGTTLAAETASTRSGPSCFCGARHARGCRCPAARSSTAPPLRGRRRRLDRARLWASAPATLPPARWCPTRRTDRYDHRGEGPESELDRPEGCHAAPRPVPIPPTADPVTTAPPARRNRGATAG